MGATQIRKHFKILHIVHKGYDKDDKEAIFIGSPYISKIIAIYPTGDVSVAEHLYEGGKFGNDNLKRYWSELRDTPKEKLKELYSAPEEFENPIIVYRVDKDRVTKIRAEQLEEKGLYPGVDADGKLMYNNTHFLDKKRAIKYLREETSAGVRLSWSLVKDKTQDHWRVISKIFFREIKNYLLARIYT